MEALILSCGTGGGHDSAGKAVMEELARRGHHAVMLNPYTLQSSRLAGKIDRVYISTVKKAPRVFGMVYQLGEAYRKLPWRSPVYYINRGMVPIMREYLSRHTFDVVFMPHLFPAEVLTNMKERGMKLPKTIFIATDYCCIPFTEETDCDAYIIPSRELAGDFSGRGIPAGKLYPYGIPVLYGFSAGQEQQKAKRRLGLPMEKKYVLISGGSMGAGRIVKMLRLLLTYVQKNRVVHPIVICGNNQKLYARIKRRYGDDVTVVGHTERIVDYMAASCLYITKPGGLSSTEAAVCGIPLVHMPPIPGCETKNVRYFSGHGMSLACEVTKRGMRQIIGLLNDGRAREQMISCQKEYISKDAAGKICELAERMVGEESCLED